MYVLYVRNNYDENNTIIASKNPEKQYTIRRQKFNHIRGTEYYNKTAK